MTRSNHRRSLLGTALLTSLALGLVACGGGAGTAPTESQSSASDAPSGSKSSKQFLKGLETKQALHKRLPEDVKKSGVLKSVMAGAFPPYTIPAKGKNDFTGASIDMGDALGKVLGVKVTTQPVAGLSGVLNGLASERYDFAIGPIGDYEERRDKADFIDWVQEFVAFLVPKGNPKNIKSIENTCGLRIAVQSGGSAERVIKEQSQECVSKGKPAIEVQSFPDQPSSVLAVRSGRSDAFFSSQAPLMYFASQSTGQLSVAAKGKANDFDPIRQGSVFPKNSDLMPVIYDAFQVLFKTGTYDQIMKKWNLQDQIISEPTINRKPVKS